LIKCVYLVEKYVNIYLISIIAQMIKQIDYKLHKK